MSYHYSVRLNLNFKDAVEKTKEFLKEEGFGILCEIDVKKVLKEKLGIDYQNYIILGACNPKLSHKALKNLPEIGLLLPCNLTIRETEKGKVIVSSIKPEALLSLVEANEDVKEVAKTAQEKLIKVVDKLTEL